MSAEDLAKARRILAGASVSSSSRPHDYDLRVAEALAAVSTAEALERIAARLEQLTDDDAGAILRVEVVPR